jgi:hypothetical protein
VHHAIGDGIALMRIALTVFEDGKKQPPVAPIETDAKTAAAAAASADGDGDGGGGGAVDRNTLSVPSAAGRGGADASPVSPLLPQSPFSPSDEDAKAAAARHRRRGSEGGHSARTAAAGSAAPPPAGGGGSGSGSGGPKFRLRMIWGALASVVKLLLLPGDPVSPLKHTDNMPEDGKIAVR